MVKRFVDGIDGNVLPHNPRIANEVVGRSGGGGRLKRGSAHHPPTGIGAVRANRSLAGGTLALDRLALFATPIFVFHLPDTEGLNRELAQRLLAERQTDPGLQRSNVGGWHSAPDLSQRPEPCYRALLEGVVARVASSVEILAHEAGQPIDAAMRYGVHAWAMIMEDGDYTTLHDHGDAHWSVVYYVDAGDTEVADHPQSGLLALVDPRRGGRPIPRLDLFPTVFTVRPRSGSMVVFPGWLQHYVHTYRGKRPRICVSANLKMTV